MTTKMRKMPSGYGMVQTQVMQLNISMQAKAVYALLASYTGSNEFCFPSIARMAKDMNTSIRSIIRHLKELEDNELIMKKKLYPKDPLKNNNKYYIMYVENDTTEVTPVSHGNCQQSHVGGDVDVTYNSNILNSNISNNNKSQEKTTSCKGLEMYYEDKFFKIFGTEPSRSYKAENKILKDLLKQFGEDVVKQRIDNYLMLCNNLPEYYHPDIFKLKKHFNNITVIGKENIKPYIKPFTELSDHTKEILSRGLDAKEDNLVIYAKDYGREAEAYRQKLIDDQKAEDDRINAEWEATHGKEVMFG